MVNLLFVLLFVLGLGYGLITGNFQEINVVLTQAPKDAFEIFINISILTVFWSGILQVCIDSGLLKSLTKVVSKLIKPLFKDLDKDSKALEYISINLAANMLGVGSAATPFGLRAMKELDELNNHSKVASKEMITLLVVNTSGICIIPSTIISLRDTYGSNNGSYIVPLLLAISFFTTAFAIIVNGMVSKHAKH